ncbi:MAG: thiamine pyrophosphate-binding protein [bacterium]
MKGTGAQILVRYLENEGVKYVFGLPGGHLLTFYDALLQSSITPILAKHEGGAGYMAAGHALVGGGLGVCCGTVGPGATNLVSGVAAAYMASLPVLVLTAQVGTPSIGKGALQEAAGVGRTFSQTELMSTVTKYSTMVPNSDKVPEALQRALRIAFSGRPGPVHLDLPADAQRGRTEDPVIDPEKYRPALRTMPLEADLRRAAELLAGAEKPGILVGAGGRKGGAPGSILRLVETLQCPVATTLPGKGAIPEDHPLALGCIGLYGTRAANSYLRSGLDVLLVVGSSLHEFSTHVWDPALQPSKGLIQVDVDPEEIGKNYPADVGLLGDAEIVLAGVLEQVEALGSGVPGTESQTGRRTERRTAEDLAALKSRTEYFGEPAMQSEDIPLKPQRVMAELREALPDETIVFTDIGNSVTWVERCFLARRPDTTMSLSGLAAMGSGVAAGVGGKLAAPDRPVVVVCGDGDFQMHGMEVMTAISHRIPVVWVIMRNDALAMIRDVQTMTYKGRYVASDFAGPDFVALAESMGALGLRAAAPGEVAASLRSALAADKPAIVEVPIDPTEMPPAKARMMALDRSLGNPPLTDSLGLGSLRALWSMLKER